jgi:AcrR family transcriptional regulator
MLRTGSGPIVPAQYFSQFVEGRRGEILDAALAVFGEKGYEAGTMREIAKRVGVTEPAIYRHYESKEAILADIVATAGDRITEQLTSQLDAFDATDLDAKLLALIEMRRGLTAEKRSERAGAGGVLHILFHAAPHNEHFISLLRAHLALPMVEAVRAAVPRVDAGFGITRSAEETNAKVRVFMSLFVGYFSTSVMFDTPPNDVAIADALMCMMGWQRR